MGHNRKKSEKSSCLFWAILIIACLVILVVLITAPVVMRLNKKAATVSTATNAKQVYLYLIEFDQDYGSFPGDSTAKIHRHEEDPDKVDDLRFCKGDYSNDYLAQLLAVGEVADKSIFLAPQKQSDISKSSKNFINSKTLEAGECGFSYVKSQATNDNIGRPVLLAPMTGEGVAFDPEPYDGKAVVLRIDGAAKLLRINKDGLAKVDKGKPLFDTGPDTVWEEDGFDSSMLVHPKPQKSESWASWTAKILVGLLVVFLVGLFAHRRSKPQRSKENV